MVTEVEEGVVVVVLLEGEQNTDNAKAFFDYSLDLRFVFIITLNGGCRLNGLFVGTITSVLEWRRRGEVAS